jgi:hypothetical protein
MKLEWLEPTKMSSRAHLCVVDDKNNLSAICGYVFLTAAAPAEKETKRCFDCVDELASGREIAIDTSEGKKVIRPKIPKRYAGSLDPFADIARALRDMDVVFMMVVGIQGDNETRYWTNLHTFGRNEVEGFSGQCLKVMRYCEQEIAKRDGS